MPAYTAAVQKLLHSKKEGKDQESIQSSTTYLIMFTRWPEHRGDVNDVIYDADGACEGRYEWLVEPSRANMGSCEWVVMGMKSQQHQLRKLSILLLFSVKHVINMNSES